MVEFEYGIASAWTASTKAARRINTRSILIDGVCCVCVRMCARLCYVSMRSWFYV